MTKPQRICWLAFNMLNNALPRYNLDRKIRERKFQLSEQRLDELWNSIPQGASPSRRLSELFWLSLPWSAILRQVGRINALEIGCGSGAYGRLLERVLGTGLERYLGVDIEAHDQWTANVDRRLSFKVGRAGDAHRYLQGINLILTQSALEHFEEDLLYFSQVSDFVKANKHPILQIHLIPTASCITTFPWHGIREYTPRTISRITGLFCPETLVYLFSLGGSRCNRTHRKYITWPHLWNGSDLRRSRMDDYRTSVRSAILSDFQGRAASSAFYALVLNSNCESDPFAQGLGA
ncbi:MAG: class I SAM-dependent methyltransferase [Steroidobacteraceae bacterium]